MSPKKNVFILSQMRYATTYLQYSDARSEKKSMLFALHMDIGIDARMAQRSFQQALPSGYATVIQKMKGPCCMFIERFLPEWYSIHA